MVLTKLKTARHYIKGVIRNDETGETLDVSYQPDRITPAVMKQIRNVKEDEVEEDWIRNLLVTWGLGWNLKEYVYPEPGQDDPTVSVELPDGTQITVCADADGKPVLADVPPTFEGMQSVSLRVLFKIFVAIQEDVHPKPTNAGG